MMRQCLLTLAVCASLVSTPHEAVAGSDGVEKAGGYTLIGGMVLSVVGMVHGITNNIVIATSDAPTLTHHRAAWAGLITSLTAIGISAVGASIAYAAADKSSGGLLDGIELIYPAGFALALIPALIGVITSVVALMNSKSYARTPTREELEARKARTEQLRRKAEVMKREAAQLRRKARAEQLRLKAEQLRRKADEMKREEAPGSEEVPQVKTSSAGAKPIPF